MKQSELLIVNFLASAARILVVIGIGFFMTRILVKQLGLEVFGLFTTIGASGMMLTMVTNTLQLSISRELGVSVGKDDSQKLAEAFSSSFYIQLIAGTAFGLVGILSSGLIANRLTIPDGYEWSTWVCLILTFIQFSFGIVASPFGGMIRAHQHIRTISVVQTVTKIAIFLCALAMIVWTGDKLVFFVAASLICNVVLQIFLVWISLRRYPGSHPKLSSFSSTSARSIFKYASLALMGGIGGQVRRNGIAIILNIFFGNIVTAANGIAIRLSSLISQFVGVILPVIQPAMNSNQGAGNKAFVERMIPLSSTLGLAITIPVAIPLIFDTEALLVFWLDTALPPYAIVFSQLITLTFIVSMISKGHGMAMHARGDIGMMTFVNQSLIILGIFAAALIACPMKQYPWLLSVGELVGLVLATSFWQPIWVSKKLELSNQRWYRFTLLPSALYIICNLLMVWLVSSFFETSVFRAFVFGAASGLICFAILWQFGFESTDREKLISFIKKLKRKIRRSQVRSPEANGTH